MAVRANPDQPTGGNQGHDPGDPERDHSQAPVGSFSRMFRH